MKKKISIFLDSGAFSFMQQKKKGLTTLEVKDYMDAYIAFIKENEEFIEVYACLDVIGDPVKSYENQQYMMSKGLNPIPVYHLIDRDVKWCARLINEFDYVAIGGMAGVGLSKRDAINQLDGIFDIVCDTKDRLPRVKVHGFGMTSLDLMVRYPWYCMTEEHQVLTKDGWRNRQDLSVGDCILSFNDGKSQWEPILEVVEFEVEKENLVYFDHRTCVARVTENHRWRVMNNKSGKWLWKSTNELNGSHRIPRVGNYIAPSKKVFSDNLVQLFAWYWTEGSIKKRPRYKKDSITIYQSDLVNPGNVKRIRDLLRQSNEKFCESSTRRSNNKEISFELYGPMRDRLLEIFPDKKPTFNFVLSLTKSQLKLFIDTCTLGDGGKTNLVRGSNSFVLGQKNGKGMEEFRMACLLAGIPTSEYSTKGMTFVRASSVEHIRPYDVKKSGNWSVKSYSGKIWCLRVSSEAFFTRCANTIYVTGNSVDSTSWVLTSRFGAVYVPRFRGGKYIYNENSWKVTVSNRSPAMKVEGQHITTFTEMERSQILEYFSLKGYKLGKSEIRKESSNYKLEEGERWFDKEDEGETRLVEVVVESGLCNDYKQRDEMNIIYFLDLEKNIPEWPWPFKLKSDVGFGFK